MKSDQNAGKKISAAGQAGQGNESGHSPGGAAVAELRRQHPTVGTKVGEKVMPTRMHNGRNERMAGTTTAPPRGGRLRGVSGLALGLMLGGATAALAAGLYTNGLGLVSPGTRYSNLGIRALVPMDTGLAQGQTPQTIAAEAFRLGMMGSVLFANQATSTAGAATLNTLGGLVTTEALTTPVGGTYTFQLTNSQLSSTVAPIIGFHSKSNTGGQPSAGAAGIQVQSVTVSGGVATIVMVNNGTTALNGTLLIAFHV